MNATHKGCPCVHTRLLLNKLSQFTYHECDLANVAHGPQVPEVHLISSVRDDNLCAALAWNGDNKAKTGKPG